MTAHRRTLVAAAAQERVIAALLATGEVGVADRLDRCMAVRLARRHGAGWIWTCRSAGCSWCRVTLARRWWAGLSRWIVQDDGPVSLAVLPLPHPPGTLRAAVVRLRRALRDVRDRAARRYTPWRSVAMAGMATGGGAAFALVSHPGIARSEAADILPKRWSAAVLLDDGAAEPS